MPYFRVSDQFHNHPKVLTAGNAAVGLWVRCGAYSANYLLDGFVPLDVAQAYGNRREIDRLVDSGLFLHVAPGGLLIANFAEHNFSADQVRAQRATDAERQRRWRGGHGDRNGVTRDVASQRDSRLPKPKPKPSSNKQAAAATAAPAAAAAIDLYIAHKVAVDQPRKPDAYAHHLRNEIPGEYREALDEYTNAHPDATENDIARAVFGMSIIDIRKATR
jgi:hypothetical protein